MTPLEIGQLFLFLLLSICTLFIVLVTCAFIMKRVRDRFTLQVEDIEQRKMQFKVDNAETWKGVVDSETALEQSSANHFQERRLFLVYVKDHKDVLDKLIDSDGSTFAAFQQAHEDNDDESTNGN